LGTQTEIVPPNPVGDFALRVFSPVLWLVDWLLIRVGLRVSWPGIGGAMMRAVDMLVNRFFF